MYRIAVLGEYDSIYGFATLGLETFPVSDAEQGAVQLKKACRRRLCSHLCDRKHGMTDRKRNRKNIKRRCFRRLF